MKPPVMKTPALATVYLDNASVGLMGDPRPLVSKIVVAGGKQPGSVQVLRSRSATDQKGKPVRMDEVIDRTAEPTQPIYLRSRPNPVDADKMASPSSVYIEFPSADGTRPRPLDGPLPKDLDIQGRRPSSVQREIPSDPEWRL